MELLGAKCHCDQSQGQFHQGFWGWGEGFDGGGEGEGGRGQKERSD